MEKVSDDLISGDFKLYHINHESIVSLKIVGGVLK